MSGPYYLMPSGKFPTQDGEPVLITRETFEACCCEKWWVTGTACESGPVEYHDCAVLQSTGPPEDAISPAFDTEAEAIAWKDANCGECELVAHPWVCMKREFFEPPNETCSGSPIGSETFCWDNTEAFPTGGDPATFGPDLVVGNTVCVLFEGGGGEDGYSDRITVVAGYDSEVACDADCGEWV